ncbi:MAG: phosphate uptake regulator PhoU [archaeon]
MTSRKLILSGGATYLISLPKEWVTRSGLKTGQDIFINENSDGSLLITPSEAGPRELRKSEIKTSPAEPPFSLTRRILGAYLRGFTEISVICDKGFTPTQKDAIRNLIHPLIGLEIIEESKTHLSAKNFLDPKEIPLPKLIQRAHLISKIMHEEITRAFRHREVKTLNEIISSDDEIDRLYFLTIRELECGIANPKIAKDMGFPLSEYIYYHLIIKRIEQIGDRITELAKILKHFNFTVLPKQVLDQLVKLSEDTYRLHCDAITVTIKKDTALVSSLLDECEHLAIRIKVMRDKMKCNSQKHAVFVDRILEKFSAILGITKHVAEAVITKV